MFSVVMFAVSVLLTISFLFIIFLFLFLSMCFLLVSSVYFSLPYSPFSVASLFLCFLLMESVADQQHFEFQQYKHSLDELDRKAHWSEDIRNGFYTQG